MQSIFIEKQFQYDGTQLRSHWVLDTTGIKGDVISAFIGPAEVTIDHMVDLEDVIRNKPIFSEIMLHFIVEHFHNDLEKTVLCQRLLISQIQQELNYYLFKTPCSSEQRRVAEGGGPPPRAEVLSTVGEPEDRTRPSNKEGFKISSVGQKVVRKGDDLFIDNDKLTVSIATSSPVSCLIHTGINISSKNTPVPTKGLQDFDINPERFGRAVMERYLEELKEVRWAMCKVRGVR